MRKNISPEILQRSLLPFILFTSSLILRLIMSSHTQAVNDDAVCYVTMAQKIIERDWANINYCCGTLGFAYSFIIAGLFFLLKDWIMSAQGASILLSSLTSLPIYFILRFYFPIWTAFIVTLISFNVPYIIKQSVDIIRDTSYWFFLSSGIYFFIKGLKDYKQYSPYSFLAGNAFFLIASLDRLESLGLWLVSIIVTLVKFRKFNFIKSFVPILFFVFISAAIFFSSETFHTQLIFGYLKKINPSIFIHNYKHLYDQLTALYESTHQFFWVYLRISLPYLPILFVNIITIKTFGHLFPLFAYGLWIYHKKRLQDTLMIYSYALMGASLFILLLWAFRYTALSKRYFLTFFITAQPFIALGLHNISTKYLRLPKSQKAYFFLVIYIIFCLLLSIKTSVTPRRGDEKNIKLVTEFLNNIENKHSEPLVIATNNYKIVFYVNLNRKPSSCARHFISPQRLHECSVDYIIISAEELKALEKKLKQLKAKKIIEIENYIIFSCRG